MRAVDIAEKRAEKAGLCDYCAEGAHKTVLSCPRIKCVRYDGEVISVYFEMAPTIYVGDTLPRLEPAP